MGIHDRLTDCEIPRLFGYKPISLPLLCWSHFLSSILLIYFTTILSNFFQSLIFFQVTCNDSSSFFVLFETFVTSLHHCKSKASTDFTLFDKIGCKYDVILNIYNIFFLTLLHLTVIDSHTASHLISTGSLSYSTLGLNYILYKKMYIYLALVQV